MTIDALDRTKPPLSRWQLSLADTLALMAGLMSTTALPPFPGTGWLAPVALALLFRALLTSPRPVTTAWIYGLAHQVSLLYWLFFLDPASTIPSRWLVPLQAVLAIFYVSLFYLLFGVVFNLARSRLGPAQALALAPVGWVGMEGLRSAGELGFPWCMSGAAWLGTPLLPLAAASGEMGLSAATAFTAAALVALFVRTIPGSNRKVPRILPVALTTASGLVWAGLVVGSVGIAGDRVDPAVADPLSQEAKVRVAAVQANVALGDKWQRSRIDSTIVPYTALTKEAAARGAELVVWAETAVPAYLRYNEPGLLSWVRQLAAENQVFLFAGFPDAGRTAAGQTLRYNSSGLFNPQGDLIDQYAKHHLLPVGERMPFSKLLPFVSRINMGQAEWTPGEPPGPILVETSRGSFRFAGLICFESIFSDLARQAVRRGAEVLVNITNDGWFGRTSGPRQHAALARLRAVECGVPLVRCANNGLSFIVDGGGRHLAVAELGERKVVLADILTKGGETLFVRAGAKPLVLFLVLWSVFVVALIRSER